jgi:hypothetical protein
LPAGKKVSDFGASNGMARRLVPIGDFGTHIQYGKLRNVKGKFPNITQHNKEILPKFLNPKFRQINWKIKINQLAIKIKEKIYVYDKTRGVADPFALGSCGFGFGS